MLESKEERWTGNTSKTTAHKYFNFMKASNTVVLIRFDYNDSFSICQSKNNQIVLSLNILYVIKRVSICMFSLGTRLDFQPECD